MLRRASVYDKMVHGSLLQMLAATLAGTACMRQLLAAGELPTVMLAVAHALSTGPRWPQPDLQDLRTHFLDQA